MAAIELSAPDAESAIAQGLAQLNMIRAEVKIEILDEGSRGVLGIGAKQARVRLTPFADIEAAAARTVPVVSVPSSSGTAVTAASTPPTVEPAQDEAQLEVEDAADETQDDSSADQDDDDQGEIEIEGADLAANLTQSVLDNMGITSATCTSRSLMPSDDHDHPSIWVDVDFEPNDEGDDDVAGLTDFNNEGWNALQLLVQTMWSHQTKSSVRITVDLNGLRARREMQVQNMATRMAERVVATGKAITLEPMAASERRLVHMALRKNPKVVTESAGEGSCRKVTIKLKK